MVGEDGEMEKRVKLVAVRLTPTEYRALLKGSGMVGMTVSDYIRWKCCDYHEELDDVWLSLVPEALGIPYSTYRYLLSRSRVPIEFILLLQERSSLSIRYSDTVVTLSNGKDEWTAQVEATPAATACSICKAYETWLEKKLASPLPTPPKEEEKEEEEDKDPEGAFPLVQGLDDLPPKGDDLPPEGDGKGGLTPEA